MEGLVWGAQMIFTFRGHTVSIKGRSIGPQVVMRSFKSPTCSFRPLGYAQRTHTWNATGGIESLHLSKAGSIYEQVSTQHRYITVKIRSIGVCKKNA
ncbi:hypothetical protein BDN72DRAFT_163701 [Pluteus cervinus]|uniref:Uncharacterized protein n=1 Tax=Pluteus cervinus TaxID=181527 RepID=A0ACD3AKJ0_9AGAR|nr:hypothetical protein BDN72DRAFT_163701 [Pluteus cervinus]